MADSSRENVYYNPDLLLKGQLPVGEQYDALYAFWEAVNADMRVKGNLASSKIWNNLSKEEQQVM